MAIPSRKGSSNIIKYRILVHCLNIPYQFDSIINELGLTIIATQFCGNAYGSYNPGRKEIRLASTDISIFLHELSHAVDDRLYGLKTGQHKDQEITAEFSGAVIGYLMSYKVPMGNVKDYIEHYSFKELLNQLSRIEKVVSYVIERTGAVNQPPPFFTGGIMKEPSFSQRLKAGWLKDDLMRYYALDEKQYDKVLACLKQIKNEVMK